MRSSTSNGWMGVTLVAAVVLGLGLGVLVDRFVLLPSVASRSTDVAVSRDDDTHDHRWQRFRDRLHRELDLTEEQEARLDEVLKRNHQIAERFWDESRRQYDELRMTFRQDIRELLTEEQRARYDRMLAEYDEKRRLNGDRDRR